MIINNNSLVIAMIYDMIIIEIRMNSRELQKFQKIQKKKIKKNTSLLPLKRRSCFALAEKDELRESRAKAQRWASLSSLLGSSNIVCSGLSLLFFSFIFPSISCISSIYVIGVANSPFFSIFLCMILVFSLYSLVFLIGFTGQCDENVEMVVASTSNLV